MPTSLDVKKQKHPLKLPFLMLYTELPGKVNKYKSGLCICPFAKNTASVVHCQVIRNVVSFPLWRLKLLRFVYTGVLDSNSEHAV